MLKIFLLAVVLVGCAMLILAVRLFFIKGGTFKKACASAQIEGENITCTCHGNTEQCEYTNTHHPEETAR